ncbi:MAG TPA: TIGR03435 family protein [Bryobacteraceae bacterium]
MRSVNAVQIIVGILGVAPPSFSQAPLAAKPSFEVASIKPSAPGTRTQLMVPPGGRFAVNGVSLVLMIAAAYRVRDYQIIGAQGWMMKDLWNIEARTASATVDPPSTTPPYLNVPDMMAVRLQSLLEDRFGLKSHRETKEMQVYVLSVDKGGSKLKPFDSLTAAQTSPLPSGTQPPVGPDGKLPPNFAPPPGAVIAGGGTILATGVPMDQIVTLLGRLTDRPIIDKSSLAGRFNVRLQFDPETAPSTTFGTTPASASPSTPATPSDPAGPSLFTAIQEQLGLKLESRRELVEVLVIDSAKPATEN